MTQKDFTLIAVIMDKSGSMWNLRESTIKGFESFLEEQKRLPGVAKMTLVQFNHDYRVDYQAAPLSDIHLNYWTDGWTALLDAVGRTIKDVGKSLEAMRENDRPSKVIFVIITDGMENRSTQYTRRQILDMISHQRERYRWEFIFMGANMDAVAEAGSIGIPVDFAANYAATAGGTQNTYGTVSASIGRIRSGGSGALTTEERERVKTGG